MPITELRIQGLRTIEDIRLRLDGLTVLIGDNGAGKSSIIEACELLRRAMSDRFMEEFYSIHGGMPALLRQGAKVLKLGVRVTPMKAPQDGVQNVEFIDYEFAMAPRGHFAVIQEELLSVKRVSEARSEQRRTIGKTTNNTLALVQEATDSESLSALMAQMVVSQLRDISIHLPFEVLPSWAARSLDRKSALRSSTLFAPADNLSRLGTNLANAYHALKNTFGQKHWQETLSYIRLGLDERVEDVTTWADPGGGNVGLSIKMKNLDEQIPTAQLSDGMLSFLAFVALFRLHRTPPSLLAFDEPDLHLHPQLLMRVLDFFEDMAKRHPVLLATHSDRLLDGLSDPARSVVLCELDERNVTRLVRPDAEALKRWLERYRGLGDIRAAGHESSIMTKVETPQ